MNNNSVTFEKVKRKTCLVNFWNILYILLNFVTALQIAQVKSVKMRGRTFVYLKQFLKYHTVSNRAKYTARFSFRAYRTWGAFRSIAICFYIRGDECFSFCPFHRGKWRHFTEVTFFFILKFFLRSHCIPFQNNLFDIRRPPMIDFSFLLDK